MWIGAGFGSDQCRAKGTEHFLRCVAPCTVPCKVWEGFQEHPEHSQPLFPRFRKNGTMQYKLLPAEAVFANTLGLLILIFGVLVVAALARPSWKRPDSDSPDSRQVQDTLGGFGKPQHSSKGGGRIEGSRLIPVSPTAPARCRALIPGISQHSQAASVCLHVPAPAWIPGHAKPQRLPVPSLNAAAGAAAASLEQKGTSLSLPLQRIRLRVEPLRDLMDME